MQDIARDNKGLGYMHCHPKGRACGGERCVSQVVRARGGSGRQGWGNSSIMAAI
jgi:hypothetical protein